MERSIVAVVDNFQGSQSNAAFSKSVVSSFKNNSLFIDLGIPQAMNVAGKCRHFSLRGYVADMRKRDRNICLPFASDGNIGNLVDELPELDVPKFRWWRCQSCLQEVGVASALEEITGEVPKCGNTGLLSGSTCHPSPSNYSSAIRMSDIQEASKSEKSERRKMDENAPANLSMNGHENADKVEAGKITSANLCGNENHSSSYSNKIGTKTEARVTAVYGHEISLDEDDVHESANADFDLCNDDPCSTEETCPDHQVAVESKSIMLADACLLTPGSNNAVGSFSGTENTKCRANSSTEAYPETEFGFVDAKVGNVSAGRKANSEEASKMSKVITTGQLVRHPSLQLEDSADRLPENDGILTGDNEQSQQDYSSGGFPRRKNRKVRLLTELLGGNKSSENNQTEGSPSNLITEVTSTSVSLSVPQGKFSPYENVRSVVSAPQRKRKIPSDQERKHVDVGCPCNVGEKARAFKGDAQASTGAIEISGSESEKNVDGVAACNSYKSHWSGRERSAVGGNKRKRAQVGEQLSSVPWQQAINKLNHAKVGDVSKHSAAADTSYLKSIHDSFTDRGMEPSFRGVMPPQRRERKSTSSKKKTRMLQVEDAQSFARPQINHTFGEGPLKRKDVEITGTEYEAGKLQLEPKLCADVLDLSLNSCISLHGDKRDYAEGATVSFTPTRKGILHGNLARKDGLNGELRVLHNSTPDRCSKEAILLNLNDKIARLTAILREQRNYSPHPSNGSFSLYQNLDFSDPHNNEKNSRIREHPEAMSLNTDQRAEVSAKGNSDDIPMEVIELLSKGKYEREWGLSQVESYRPTSDNTRNENVITSPKANGNGVVPFLQINYPSTAIRKPTSNATIDMITAANVAATNNDPLKFSAKERSLFNMGQVGNPPFSDFEAFSPSQPKVPSDAHFSHSGFLSIRNLQNSEQRRKLIAQLPSPTNMKIFEPFNRTHNSLQQSEAGSIWSSLAPNHMPFGHNIPQKFPNQSSNKGMHAQLMGPDKGKRILNFDLNAVDLNGASIEEQDKRASAEYPFLTKNIGMELNPKGKGPSDVSHCEETIPAMQLLSLMDAGTQSSKPLGLDGKKFLSKPFFPISNHPSFSSNEKPSFLEKPLFPKSGLMPGSGESSRHFSSALIRENLPGKFYEYPSAVPSIDSLFRNVEKSPGFTDQVLRTPELGKGKGSYSAAHNRAFRLDKSVSTGGDRHNIGHPNPGKGKGKWIFTAVNSLVYPLQRHRIEDSSNCSNLGPLFMHETVRPMKDWPCTDVCTVNRNPADFSVPEAGNEYMISCEDLKCGKKVFPWGKSVLKDLNGKKKRRITKDHISK